MQCLLRAFCLISPHAVKHVPISVTAMQRRCYWLLDGDDGTVLVHYLASKKLGRANSDPRCQSEPMLPHFWDTARADDYERLPYSNKAQRTYQGGLQDTCMSFEQVLSLGAHGCTVLTACCASCPLHTAFCKVRSKHDSKVLEHRYCSTSSGLNRVIDINSVLEGPSCCADCHCMCRKRLSSVLYT